MKSGICEGNESAQSGHSESKNSAGRVSRVGESGGIFTAQHQQINFQSKTGQSLLTGRLAHCILGGERMRTSSNEFDGQGVLLHGFDYDKQAWVKYGRYVRCGHPDTMDCRCYGREHEGEPVRVSIETLDLD